MVKKWYKMKRTLKFTIAVIKNTFEECLLLEIMRLSLGSVVSWCVAVAHHGESRLVHGIAGKQILEDGVGV